jgi:23S rRNA (guanosine2251-2'-O)-methyltransferase
MFCTVLHTLQSPQNVGMIVRSHVAFGGDRIVMVGYEQPWRFGKRTQAFSRKLERLCEFVHIPIDDEFFAWCERESFVPVALEIASPPQYLDEFRFPPRVALVVGSESSGLARSFLARCAHVVTVPQFGAVGCLNVAVACSMAIYELNRGRRPVSPVEGSKYIGKERAG